MRWVRGSLLLEPVIGGSHDGSVYIRNLDTNNRTLFLVVLSSSEESVYQHITDVFPQKCPMLLGMVWVEKAIPFL